MAGHLRDDLMLTAYALSLGFTVKGDHDSPITNPALFNTEGVPPEALQFLIGDVHVWSTSRGWRVARIIDGLFEKPTPSDFFSKLKDALDRASENWRDR